MVIIFSLKPITLLILEVNIVPLAISVISYS